jgi:hypothetical protein
VLGGRYRRRRKEEEKEEEGNTKKSNNPDLKGGELSQYKTLTEGGWDSFRFGTFRSVRFVRFV